MVLGGCEVADIAGDNLITLICARETSGWRVRFKVFGEEYRPDDSRQKTDDRKHRTDGRCLELYILTPET